MSNNRKKLSIILALSLVILYSKGQVQQFRNNTNVIVKAFEISADSILSKGKMTSLELFKSSMSSPSARQVKLGKTKKKLLSSKDIYNQAIMSTVIVGSAYLCPHCSNTHLSNASGYIISEEGYVVTNAHVVKGYVNMPEGDKPLGLFVRLYDGRTFEATQVVALSEKDDIAILKLDAHGEKLPAFGLSKGAYIGDDAYVLGHPKGMYYFFTKGIVNAKFQEPYRGGKNGNFFDVMNISADYAAGSSGGPVIDTYGNIIGTVSSTRTIKYHDPDQSVQMVLKSTIPVESLWKLLDDLKAGKMNGGQTISFLNSPSSTAEKERSSEQQKDNGSTQDLEALKAKYKGEMIKKQAPDFSLKNMQGEVVSLSDFKGKVVVLDFWATWCKPCIGSFPGMQAAVEKYSKDKDVVFLFIDCFERQENYEAQVRSFIAENKYAFQVLFDHMSENESITKGYNIKGIPNKVVIDKEGFIRFQSSGSGTDVDRIVNEISTKIEIVRSL
ncbi:trypsin-like peptidase domain-containing protein [Sphingobacterium sp. LRF_L2]|uniref:trypsin-like peptidase domain-containing protein n=1 Tax=Sphingobacterium sp. LRF_L2 TaxID=3369421 RepID=UPI003F5D6143